MRDAPAQSVGTFGFMSKSTRTPCLAHVYAMGVTEARYVLTRRSARAAHAVTSVKNRAPCMISAIQTPAPCLL